MATRKPRKPLRGFVKGNNPITEAPSSTASGRMEILLEAMRSDNRTTYEAVLLTRESLQRQLSEQRTELSARLDVLESAVRRNSEDIRKNSDDIRKNSDDIRKNSEDIQRLEMAVTRVRDALSQKADKADLDQLEKRVAALEQRVPL